MRPATESEHDQRSSTGVTTKSTTVGSGDVPQRVQLSRAAGWRMPVNTVKVDRSSDFGNPFPADVYGAPMAVDLFRRWVTGNMSSLEMSGLSRHDRWPDVSLVAVRGFIRNGLPRLRGKNLACWCKPDAPCHADVLLELAND